MEPKNNFIILGGGCFWGVQELIRSLEYVSNTEVGYAGSDYENPVYSDVKTGMTGHAEVVKISYLDTGENLKKLIHYFFRLHDPTTLNRQENDIGSQYRSIILFRDSNQERIIKEVLNEVKDSNRWTKPIVTEVAPLAIFYPAEEYHQDYLQKFPQGYNCHYLRD